MNRRNFVKGLAAVTSALAFWRPTRPTVILPKRDPELVYRFGSLVRSPNGAMYRVCQSKQAVHSGDIVYWENGEIAGMAVTTIDRGNYGFIQITNVPLTVRVTGV